ncbi:peptidoglycan DD-metalloendopeptidase family protein [Sphingomonas sp. ASV193]|uniref:murein hydrolase activator EnvC family protein n=1 Tax=Sphingomonas sp. ASV193 TaxID=3144405 RepID=UPI0032E91F7D
MKAALALLAIPLAFAAASSALAPPGVDQRLAAAEAEAAQAEARAKALGEAATRAGDEAARLAAGQRAAAAEIEAAEARISAAQAGVEEADAALDASRAQLRAQRAPLAALLAGVATMGRRPPLLALAGDRSPEEMVRLRAMIDATMPWIATKSAGLRAEVARGRDAAAAAANAKQKLAANIAALTAKKAAFAALERQSEQRAARLGGQAFGAEDRVLAAGESVGALGSEAAAAAAARRLAQPLAATDFAPARPGSVAAPVPPMAYSLPADAPVEQGLGAVDRSGVVARGVRLATARGAAVIAPADGHILFAGPYRATDGLVIIDHGGGWRSLLIGVATELPRGASVTRGQPLGRALGPLEVELRHGGTIVSPALIAGSSAALSNGRETR